MQIVKRFQLGIEQAIFELIYRVMKWVIWDNDESFKQLEREDGILKKCFEGKIGGKIKNAKTLKEMAKQ
jgi:hypothetical protein